MDYRDFDVPRYLSVLPLFKGICSDVLQRITAAAQLRRLYRSETVFRADDPCAHYNVTVVGQVKLIALSAAGQEKVIELAGPAMSFGEAQLISGATHGFSAQALTDTLLLQVERQALLNELSQDPGLAMRMLQGLSSRLQGLMQDVQAYTLHSGQQRVIDYLLTESTRADRHGSTVSLPASKATIASRLSITPEYFSRVLHDLEAAGLLLIDRRSIRIPDAGRLASRNHEGAASPRTHRPSALSFAA